MKIPIAVLPLLLLAVVVTGQRRPNGCFDSKAVSRAIEECVNATRNEGGRWPFGGGRWPIGEGQGPFGGGRWPLGEGQGPFGGGRWPPFGEGQGPFGGGRWPPFGEGRWPFDGDRPFSGGMWPFNGDNDGGQSPGRRPTGRPDGERPVGRPDGGRPVGRPDGGRPGGRPDGGRPGGWPFPGYPFTNFPFPGFGQRRNCGTEVFTGVRNNSATIDFDSVKQNLGRVANPDKLTDLQAAVDRCRTAYQTQDANSDNIRRKNREYNQCFMREVQGGCRGQQPATQQPGNGGNPDNGGNTDNGVTPPGRK